MDSFRYMIDNMMANLYHGNSIHYDLENLFSCISEELETKEKQIHAIKEENTKLKQILLEILDCSASQEQNFEKKALLREKIRNL